MVLWSCFSNNWAEHVTIELLTPLQPGYDQDIAASFLTILIYEMNLFIPIIPPTFTKYLELRSFSIFKTLKFSFILPVNAIAL